MLHAVLRSPLSFFELTPTGRYVSYRATLATVLTKEISIMNLFSRDTYVVDQVLARVSPGARLNTHKLNTPMTGHPRSHSYTVLVRGNRRRHWHQFPVIFGCSDPTGVILPTCHGVRPYHSLSLTC